MSEAENALLSSGLSFCPTPAEIDVYTLRKDVLNYVRRIRLKEYFYSDEETDGDFSEIPALEVPLEPHQRRTKALEDLRSYDDIVIKQADKGSAVVVMDKERYVTEAVSYTHLTLPTKRIV